MHQLAARLRIDACLILVQISLPDQRLTIFLLFLGGRDNSLFDDEEAKVEMEPSLLSESPECPDNDISKVDLSLDDEIFTAFG